MGGCSMIDGITINTSIANKEEWSILTGVDLSAPTYISTGEIKVKKRGNVTVAEYRGKWEGFFIDVREVKRGVWIKYYLNIRGSFHKNHFKGENWQPFNFSYLQYQIRHICTSLFIEPESARISGLEFGVNIITPFTVKSFLDNNVIDYKHKVFENYKRDKNGLELGLHCILSQYEIKLYNKGKQNKLDYNLMRFEKKCKKMQVLKKHGIVNLSDLLDKAKVYSLIAILLRAWKDVLIYDIEDTELLSYKISEEDRRFLSDGRNYKYWGIIKKANRNNHNYKRKKYKELVKRFGLNYHTLIYNNLGETWDSLFDNSTNLPVVISTQLNNLTIKIKGKYNESISKYCNPCIWSGPVIVKYN
jgi:hypothetical protein